MVGRACESPTAVLVLTLRLIMAEEVIELSIDETQALRAKLGLPPLRGQGIGNERRGGGGGGQQHHGHGSQHQNVNHNSSDRESQ